MATVVIATSAAIVMGALAIIVCFTFWRGHSALTHLNFFHDDLSRAGPLDPLTAGGVFHAVDASGS